MRGVVADSFDELFLASPYPTCELAMFLFGVALRFGFRLFLRLLLSLLLLLARLRVIVRRVHPPISRFICSRRCSRYAASMILRRCPGAVIGAVIRAIVVSRRLISIRRLIRTGTAIAVAGARFLRRHFRSMILSSRSARPAYVASREISGPGCRRYCRTPVVLGRK